MTSIPRPASPSASARRGRRRALQGGRQPEDEAQRKRHVHPEARRHLPVRRDRPQVPSEARLPDDPPHPDGHQDPHEDHDEVVPRDGNLPSVKETLKDSGRSIDL